MEPWLDPQHQITLALVYIPVILAVLLMQEDQKLKVSLATCVPV